MTTKRTLSILTLLILLLTSLVLGLLGLNSFFPSAKSEIDSGKAERPVGALLDEVTERSLLDKRTREQEVQRILDTGDGQEMARAAAVLAHYLPFAEAIDSIAVLKSGSPNTHFGDAYMVMAKQSAAKLASDYQRRLTKGLHPAHRRQTIVALSSRSGQTGLDSARMAFVRDPDYEVKGVALMALGSRLGSTEFEPLVNSAIADPRFENHLLLAMIANAIINHATNGGEVNVVDRSSRALLASPKLPERLRERLMKMREQYIPK